ncbi:MAG: hypothetical protein JWN07_513, partial [Hyphomicrobiales bacterium]|nr:hypothetical protein [Hyphomicrobiales bacterium]
MEKTPAGERASFALLALALFALYLVTHPWRGVHGDALIYVTRAFAPPAVLEGDMLFTHERQTLLTIYGLLLGWLSHVAPVADAARGLALLGGAVWFAGLVLLMRAIARAAHLPMIVALCMSALVALAPLSYSAGSSFLAGEILAVPRPFAEGFVLMAFATLLEKRWLAGCLALAGAMAFHPLIGAAGAAVAFTWAALGDRRLWLVAALCACLVVAVATVSNRLDTFDADWLALLRLRTAYLFISQAPASFWVDLLLRGVILFIAARLCFGRLRLLLRAVLVASVLGLLVSLLFADLWPIVFVTQAQPWRVLFIPAILAPAAVALIACKGEGPATRVTLALIACALMTRDVPLLSVVFSLGALAFHIYPPVVRLASSRIEAALWIVATAAWVGFDLMNLVAFGQILGNAPDGFSLPWSYLWVLRSLALPLSVLAIV